MFDRTGGNRRSGNGLMMVIVGRRRQVVKVTRLQRQLQFANVGHHDAVVEIDLRIAAVGHVENGQPAVVALLPHG